MVIAALLVASPAPAPPAEPRSAAGESEDRYAVPTGDVGELVEFIERLAQFQPVSTRQDIEHRAKFRPALQEAAEAIIELEKDETAQAYQAAEYILLANRAHWIAQGTSREQRRTIADARAYLRRNLDGNQAKKAASAAMSVGQTLERCGEWRLAAAAYASFAEILSESTNGEVLGMRATMAAKARQLETDSEGLPLRPDVKIQPNARMVPLDLTSKLNWRVVTTEDGRLIENGFSQLRRGERVLGAVKFRIDDRTIQLGSKNLAHAPAKVEGIPVNRRISRFYVLQAAQYGSPRSVLDGTTIGEYKIHYEDDSTASMAIVYGEDVRDWWNWDDGRPATRGKVVWTGSNPTADESGVTLRLYLGVWENPHPEKKLTNVDIVSTMNTICAPFCVAITLEDAAGSN